MNIPNYWAEHTLEFIHKNKKTKIKRYGWSDVSQSDAQEHAIERCQQAYQTLFTTGKVKRIEGKNSYLDATGLPIREQVITRYPDLNCVTTINSYGATCINVANVMILDIDNEDIVHFCWEQNHIDKPRLLSDKVSIKVSIKAGFFIGLILSVILMLSLPASACDISLAKQTFRHFLLLLSALPLGFAMGIILLTLCDFIDNKIINSWIRKQGGYLSIFEVVMKKFLQNNDDFAFNLYQTPLGFRLIALQDTFYVNDEQTQCCFSELPVDRNYARLCQVQQCFRARATAKPWRMGQDTNNDIEPRIPSKYFWLDSEKKVRHDWLQHYHQAAKGYAACHFVKQVGQAQTHPQVAKVIALHNKLCQSHSHLPMA